MSFANLKRSSDSLTQKLVQELNKVNSPQTERGQDDRFWQPSVDKAGNGYAVIRFLPAPDQEDVPFVRVWDHGFQGTGGWYIENSLTTLGQKDPVSEYNSQLWNTGNKADQEQVRKQKRRLTYISNIYVISDPANPGNEGKVFLYKYGKKIFDKLNDLMNPQFQDERPVNPFDLWNGANFKLKIRKLDGYRNYDKSEFDTPAPLFDEDDRLERIWTQEHSLQDFLNPKHFKSYGELKARLDKVLGLTGGASQPRNVVEDTPPWDEAPVSPAPQFKERPAPAIQAADGDDEDLEFFKRLADED
jgi:hypothetical protein